MVGNLIKHELISYYRTTWPISIAAVLLSVITSVMSQIQRLWMIPYFIRFFAGASAFALIFAAVYIIFISIAKRFRDTMYKGEAYMPFSLPASSTQLILAKMLAAFLLSIYTVILVFFCCTLFFSILYAENASDVFIAWWLPWRNLMIGFATDPLLATELLFLILVGMVLTIFLLYNCIAVGHMFRSRKNLMAVLFLFAVSAVIVFLEIPVWNLYVRLIEYSLYLALLAVIILCVVLSVVGFFLLRYLVRHKLNLVL